MDFRDMSIHSQPSRKVDDLDFGLFEHLVDPTTFNYDEYCSSAHPMWLNLDSLCCRLCTFTICINLFDKLLHSRPTRLKLHKLIAGE